MKKHSASRSAFFISRVLISVAFCSIVFFLASLVFALYPDGRALAQSQNVEQTNGSGQTEQYYTAREVPGVPKSFTKEISTPDRVALNNSNPSPPLQSTSCVATVLPNNGGLSGNERAPHTNFRFGRSVYLITAAELAASLYPSGTIPSTIGWNYQTGPGIAGSAPLKIYMQNTTDTTNNKSGIWATAIIGMTTVHNATTALPSTAGPFDITLTGGTPFTYTGGGLYIAFDWGQYTGTLSTTAQVFCNTSLVGGLLGNQDNITAPLTVAASNFRPETRLSSTVNDIAPSFIYSFGQVPRNLVPAQIFKAVINNKGSFPQTNLPVTLNITGADTFTNTQTIPSLASCNGQGCLLYT